MRSGFALALVLAFAPVQVACSSPSGESLSAGGQAAPENRKSGADSSAVHPESGLAVIPLAVHTRKTTHRFRVEFAQSPFDQAKGLMFRTTMGDDEGMLFPFEQPREASFWMRNTVIPLDIIFIGADRRIINIEANAVPYSEDKRRSAGKAAAVLELTGGRAAVLGIAAGDKVTW